MPYTIITHDGKAHMDELLGIALLALYIGEEPETIKRMDPQMASKLVASGDIPENTWFIDCGLIYDRERKLFDHHQNRELDCAALLIFNEYFKHLHDTELHDYIKLVSKIDTKGAMSLDDFHLVSESRDYFSFSHNILLRTFEDSPQLVLRLLLMGLQDKIAFEKSKKVAALWRKEPGNMEIVTLEGLKILRYVKKPPSELVSPLRSEINKIVEEHNISATISFDDKIPEARTLYRTNYGHNRIDYTRSSPSKTLFCHQGGFLLKFVPAEENEWERLLKEAIISL
jgi:Uncharacterised protein family (UPF0160)